MGESGLGDQLSEKLLEPAPTPAAEEEKETEVVPRESHSEASMKAGDMGLPSADESLSNSEMKKMHDAVDSYLKSSLGTGNYKDLLDKAKDETGVWANHINALVRAKIAKRKRGESGDAKDLCIHSSLADEGLTKTDIFNLDRYLSNHLRDVRNFEAWSREVRSRGVYGAYLRALALTKGTSIHEVLEKMKEEGMPLRSLAIVATETSYLDLMQQLSS